MLAIDDLPAPFRPLMTTFRPLATISPSVKPLKFRQLIFWIFISITRVIQSDCYLFCRLSVGLFFLKRRIIVADDFACFGVNLQLVVGSFEFAKIDFAEKSYGAILFTA